MCLIQYPKPLRPIWTSHWPQWDVQGAIPFGWCEECGREVFSRDDRLCRRCLNCEKERKEDENESVRDL